LKTKILCFISIIFIIAADQLSKIHIKAITHSSSENSLPFIKIGGKRIIDITYCENTGAAFSTFSGNKLFLIGLTSLLMIFCLVYLFKTKDKRQIFCLAMIIGGGIGNLIDRIFRGYVVDFFEIKPFTFGIFNVADSFVCIGVFFFVLFSIIDEVRDFKNRKSEGTEGADGTEDAESEDTGAEIVSNENSKTVSNENGKTVLSTNIIKAVNSKNVDGAKIKSAESINRKSADGKSARFSNGVNVKIAEGVRLNCADSAELKTVKVSRVKPGVRVMNLKSEKGENR
jgi:signal peptidase II